MGKQGPALIMLSDTHPDTHTHTRACAVQKACQNLQIKLSTYSLCTFSAECTSALIVSVIFAVLQITLKLSVFK